MKRTNKKSKKAQGKETYQKVTADQILGDTGINKYGTFDQEEYENKITDMNKSDLQTHALKLGVPPIDDVPRLRKNLMTEFRKHLSIFRTPTAIKGRTISESTLPKEVLKIMAEGR